jgi:Ca2+-binding EF-hand superfamily protein
MRIRTTILSMAIVGLVAGVSWADPEKKRDGKGRDGEMRKKMIEKFDADGDGKLNEEERGKAKAAMKKRRGERPEGTKRGEGRKPGERGLGHHGPHHAEFHKKMLEKYDADKDGKLSKEERGEAKEEMKKHMQEMRAKRIKRFDADGDGKLNEEERAKAHEEMKKRHSDRKPGDRKPGAGRPDGAKRPGGPGPRSPEFRKKMLEKFDADGDGKLSEEERAKARKEFHSKRGKRGEKKEV